MENRTGKGKTVLIGTYPGAAYYMHHDVAAKDLYSGFLDWAGVVQNVKTNNAQVQARLHGGNKAYLWITNPTSREQSVTATLARDIAQAKDIWAQRPIVTSGKSLTLSLPAKDAAVIELG